MIHINGRYNGVQSGPNTSFLQIIILTQSAFENIFSTMMRIAWEAQANVG